MDNENDKQIEKLKRNTTVSEQLHNQITDSQREAKWITKKQINYDTQNTTQKTKDCVVMDAPEEYLMSIHLTEGRSTQCVSHSFIRGSEGSKYSVCIV